MPAHHNAEDYLDAYIEAAGIAGEQKGPLFRTVDRQDRQLTDRPMHRNDALRMIKRRAKAAGLPDQHLLPHLPGHRHHRLPGKRRHHRRWPAILPP